MPTKVTKTGAAETLSILRDMAPALRAAGVRRFKIGDVEADLAPPDPPAPERTRNDERTIEYDDPLDDPSTFGGGKVPGFERPESDDDL